MCNVLNELYKKIFKEDFIYTEFDKRIKMQKAVYLLENMGIHVGDYSFSWNKYGPYSLSLDGNAKRCWENSEKKEVVFTELAEKKFEIIRKYLNRNQGMSDVHWIECITSIHYLKNIMRIDENDLYDELVKRKPHLNNSHAFQEALEIVKTI